MLAGIDPAAMGDLVLPALSIAALGAIESLLCGAVAGNMTGTKMDNNQELIGQGLRHLDCAASGRTITAYHVEAAIAAAHAVAVDDAATDWGYVVRLYDDLLAIKPSPVVELNRAIALAMAEGPAVGIAAIERIEQDPALARYYLLPAALGRLWLEAGELERAARAFEEALTRSCSAPERRFLERQLTKCRPRVPR